MKVDSMVTVTSKDSGFYGQSGKVTDIMLIGEEGYFKVADLRIGKQKHNVWFPEESLDENI